VKRAAARGYTAVEVMMSIAMLVVGAAGVVAMQKAAVQGNQDSRDIDMATNIAREWMARVQRDAMLWTPSDTGPLTNLSSAPLVNESPTGKWYIPKARQVKNGAFNSASQNDWESAAFDLLGRDMASLSGPSAVAGAISQIVPRYCTNLRVTPATGDSSMMRVEVRVFWPRMIMAAPPTGFCTVVPSDTDTNTYHFVYLVSAVRMNGQP
jgi:type II secretory pathway pseudopilin PulG